ICANMAEYDNFLEPKFMYEGKMLNFEGKPPLYFQIGGLFCKIFGHNEFSVRLPALIAALGILLILYRTVRTLRNERIAVLSMLFCLTAPVFLVFSGLCMTDMLLSLSISGGILFYIRFLSEENRVRRKKYSFLFFASLGIGMMAKGPVALVLAGLPIFFFTLINGRWKDLKDHAWITGTLIFLLISVPWFLMMQRKNPDFLEYFFINENFKRFLFKEYGDRYGSGRESFRGMALVFFAVCNLPFLLFALIPAYVRRPDVRPFLKKMRDYLRDPLTGISLLSVLSISLFWSLTSRVLITYLLPTIPFASCLVAELLEKSGVLEQEKWSRLVVRTLFGFFFLYNVILIALSCYPPPVSEAAGHDFVRISAIPEFAERKIYFMRETPYSAEFYLGDRVAKHPDELGDYSVMRSQECLLFAKKRQVRKLHFGIGERKLIAEFSGWQIFAPGPAPVQEQQLPEPPASRK
ncbi:glycosyltransferase family 39 protein, partial [bacterium]|nr:glycosyltransferase family 39 protein [bacterium]